MNELFLYLLQDCDGAPAIKMIKPVRDKNQTLIGKYINLKNVPAIFYKNYVVDCKNTGRYILFPEKSVGRAEELPDGSCFVIQTEQEPELARKRIITYLDKKYFDYCAAVEQEKSRITDLTKTWRRAKTSEDT